MKPKSKVVSYGLQDVKRFSLLKLPAVGSVVDIVIVAGIDAVVVVDVVVVVVIILKSVSVAIIHVVVVVVVVVVAVVYVSVVLWDAFRLKFLSKLFFLLQLVKLDYKRPAEKFFDQILKRGFKTEQRHYKHCFCKKMHQIMWLTGSGSLNFSPSVVDSSSEAAEISIVNCRRYNLGRIR